MSSFRGCVLMPDYSALSASSNRDATAARVATMEEMRPVARIANSISHPLVPIGRRPPCSAAAGKVATSAQIAPATRPHTSSSALSATTIMKRRLRLVADGAEQRQLAAPFEHVSQQHRGQADGAEQETQAAERLEGGEVGVLDTVEFRQPIRRPHGVGAEVARAFLDGVRDGGARSAGASTSSNR